MSNVVAEAGLNQIPVGYKQTEVGVIPEDWDLVSLENMAIPNGLVRGPFGGAIKKEHFTKTGYKVYEQRNAIYETVEIGNYYIDQKKFDELKRFSISHNDFIVSCSGTIGRIYQIPKRHPKGVINQALLKITLNHNIDSKYFYHYFKWNVFQERIIDGTQGGAMKNLVGMAEFKQSLIPLPSVQEEQTAIANALSDVDALITELEKLIAKKQSIKTATMQQLLTGRTRLPQFALREDGSKKGTKQSELGEIPEDWEIISISHDTTLKARIGWQALTTKEYQTTGDIYLVTGTDFDSGVVKWERCFYVSEWRYKQDQNIQLRNDDVLITKDGTIGKVGFVATLNRPATLNSGVFVIRPKYNNLIPRFLFYVLTSIIFDDFINRITAGSTITHLYQKDFVNFAFSAPDTDEQTAIATILSDMDEEIQALDQRLSKTRQIKQGMMQELLTGKTRLV
ncbi:restriction endonuclease subunit S [uncultured Gilliamella sp.]|uniref:restriction endonuclease subunit S n=1 Tax=uncultured Gilliamella sp. TaxID=1193505 RepID=UPI0025EEF948|nr:restriction endonuclease subunit S [uncultured Gilliamella sp.]